MKNLIHLLLVGFLAMCILPTDMNAQQNGTTIRDKGNKPPLKKKAMKAKKKMNSQKDYSTKKIALLAEHQMNPKFIMNYEKIMFDLAVRNKEEQKTYWMDILSKLEAKGHISANSPLKEIANWSLGENSGYSKDRKDKLIRVLAGDKFTDLEKLIANSLIDIEDIPNEDYDQNASSGEDVGGAIGTIAGAIGGFITGGVAGGIAGALLGEELGKLVGKAIGILINAISGKGGSENGGKGGNDGKNDDDDGKSDDNDSDDVEPEGTGVEGVGEE